MSLDAHPLVSDWLNVAEGRFVISSGKVDIGQRISTALCLIVAQELSLDPDEIDVATVTTGLSPDEGITSGSNSIEQSGRALRLASATLREVLLKRAFDIFGSGDLDLRDGLIVDRRSNRTVHLTEIAAKLDASLAVDRDAPSRIAEPPVQKPPRGMREMTDGSYMFIQDVVRPNMLHARVIRPPHSNARLREIDAHSLARLKADELQLVRDGSFLAIAGQSEYVVICAAERLALACEWDAGPGLDDRSVFDLLVENPRVSRRVEQGVPTEGGLPDPLESPSFTARYERPYQLHGSLAPSAALAEYMGGSLSIHSHSQGVYPLRESIAEALALRIGDVRITHCPSSGCYGHNGADDAAFEAALIARAIPDRPILLKWTRQDEHTCEPVAPAMVVDVFVEMEDGRISAWSQEAYSDTHRGRPRPGPDRAGPSRFGAARLLGTPEKPFLASPNMGRHAGIHRNLDPIYEIPDKRLTKHLVRELPLRTSAMRCLGGAANLFAIESTIDDLAARAKVDPLVLRREHLTDPRAHQVIDKIEKHEIWDSEKPERNGRGVAYGHYKNVMARVGVLVELMVDDSGKVVLDQALIVADAGHVVDPIGLRAQLEGGFIQAASWCLHENFQYDRSGPISRNWGSYPVIRFDEIPKIETVLLSLDNERSLGSGEAACGPTLAAIANAIYDAVGLRLRKLPFRPENVRSAALNL